MRYYLNTGSRYKTLHALCDINAGRNKVACLTEQAAVAVTPALDAFAPRCRVATETPMALREAQLAAIAVCVVRQRYLRTVAVVIVCGEIVRHTQLVRQLSNIWCMAQQMVIVNMSYLKLPQYTQQVSVLIWQRKTQSKRLVWAFEPQLYASWSRREA